MDCRLSTIWNFGKYRRVHFNRIFFIVKKIGGLHDGAPLMVSRSGVNSLGRIGAQEDYLTVLYLVENNLVGAFDIAGTIG